jgi:hypothetical protein
MKNKIKYNLRIVTILVFMLLMYTCSKEDGSPCEYVEQGDFVLVE